MEKQEKLKLVYDKLVQVGHFLQRFLCLANTHNSYFIADNVWTELIPAQVAQDLLDLPLDILARLPGGILLDERVSVSNLSLNAKHKYDETNMNGGLSVFELCPVTESDSAPQWDESLKPCWNDIESLASFLVFAHQNSVPGLDILSPSADVIMNLQKHANSTTADSQISDEKSSDGQARLCIDSFMNVKKSHEVQKMAQFCASVARNSKLNQAVEVGCGRAYLASQLALLHGLTVVGVEANSSHTQSAQQRISKFSQQLPGLLRNAEEDLQAGFKMKRGKHFRSKQRQKEAKNLNAAASAAAAAADDATGLSNDSLGVGSIGIDNDSGLEQDFSLLFTSSDSVGVGNENELGVRSIDKETVEQPLSVNKEISAVNSSAAALDVDRASINREWRKKAKAKKKAKNDAVTSGIHLVTAKVTNSTKLDDILNQANLNSETAAPCAMLVGLHTCGSLACDILRMFAQSDAAGAVCVVGCCYQWMEERFLHSPYYGAGERPSPGFEMDVGFPMSHFLQSRHAQIGRNARLLTASLPMANNRLPEKSMFWRAVLQVILTDITGLRGHNWIVGKMPPSCSSFVDYVQRALTKLGLPQLSVEVIEGYLKKYTSFEVKVTAFFQLRGVVARSVEALILLDRLAYVLEQETVAEAHLVQLFDPVVSPRCYGIVAWKSSTRQVN